MKWDYRKISNGRWQVGYYNLHGRWITRSGRTYTYEEDVARELWNIHFSEIQLTEPATDTGK